MYNAVKAIQNTIDTEIKEYYKKYNIMPNTIFINGKFYLKLMTQTQQLEFLFERNQKEIGISKLMGLDIYCYEGKIDFLLAVI